VASVFAGFVVGYVLALVTGPVAAVLIVRSNHRSGVAQRLAPSGTSVIALSVVLHFAAILLLTALGLIAGMVLHAIESRRPQGGLGSPNLLYTLLVVAFTAVLVIPALAFPAARKYAAASAVVLLAAFGWLMPWMAQLG
jgi:hypothetical protein